MTPFNDFSLWKWYWIWLSLYSLLYFFFCSSLFFRPYQNCYEISSSVTCWYCSLTQLYLNTRSIGVWYNPTFNWPRKKPTFDRTRQEPSVIGTRYRLVMSTRAGDRLKRDGGERIRAFKSRSFIKTEILKIGRSSISWGRWR